MRSLRYASHLKNVSAPMKTSPDFFIAGNSKSGTTALYHYLARHPAICMSNPKEPNFFAEDFLHNEGVGAFSKRTVAEYRQCFAHATTEELWGEASACYLYSTEAAAQIHAVNPDAKIIAIFREPVDFLFSYHLQMLQNPVSEGETEKDFTAALALEHARKQGRQLPEGCLIPQLLYYSERVHYTEQLLRFRERFGPEQMRVYVYEDFKSDNEGVFRDILSFLDLDPAQASPDIEQHNRSVKVKSKLAQNFAFNVSHGNGWYAPLHTAVKAVVPRPARRFLTRSIYNTLAFKPKPTLDRATQQKLKHRFLPQVESFSEVMGVDLVSRWAYPTKRRPSAVLR